MKKITLMSALLVALCSKAQFSHSIGGGFVGLTGENTSLSLPSIFYSPRINFMELSENMTLSAGSHVGVGFNLSSSSNSRTGGSSSSSFLNFQLPLLAELNFGRKCNSDNDDNFGFFVGGGGGLNYAAMSGSSVSSIGPMGNAGIRFKIADYSLGLRGAYLFDVSSNKLNVFVINLLYDL